MSVQVHPEEFSHCKTVSGLNVFQDLVRSWTSVFRLPFRVRSRMKHTDFFSLRFYRTSPYSLHLVRPSTPSFFRLRTSVSRTENSGCSLRRKSDILPLQLTFPTFIFSLYYCPTETTNIRLICDLSIPLRTSGQVSDDIITSSVYYHRIWSHNRHIHLVYLPKTYTKLLSRLS